MLINELFVEAINSVILFGTLLFVKLIKFDKYSIGSYHHRQRRLELTALAKQEQKVVYEKEINVI